MEIDHDLLDVESLGCDIEGLSLNQIRLLKEYYQIRSHDMDLEKLEFYVKGYVK